MSMNPYEEVPDDSVCAFCGKTLPDVMEEPYAFNGFCDAECALRMIVAELRKREHTVSIGKLHKGDHELLDAAISDVTRAYRETRK